MKKQKNAKQKTEDLNQRIVNKALEITKVLASMKVHEMRVLTLGDGSKYMIIKYSESES